ncbi:MAG: class I SAM-dependent methyltransferase [Rhodospirillales bacterium]
MRERLRRRWMGLATVLDLRAQGFFIPHRYADAVSPPADYPAAEALFARARGEFAKVLGRIDAHGAALGAIAADAPAPAARWNQDWFARLDAAAAYVLVREIRPRTIVEVGSGHSTRFLARAVADGKLGARIVAIDPEPRADLGELKVEWRREAVQQTPDALFAALGPGDMLFVDSSHVLMPGTDVDHLLSRVLPALAPGVLAHLHDIFLPDRYPREWDWRGFNEQLGVLALLQGGACAPAFASRYAVTRMAQEFQACAAAGLPLPAGAFESSLWLRKL